MKYMIMMVAIFVYGCSNVSQEELNAKINKCTEAGMVYTYMKDFRGKPYDVVCVRRHDNEK